MVSMKGEISSFPIGVPGVKFGKVANKNRKTLSRALKRIEVVVVQRYP